MYLEDCWYVAAERHELTDRLLTRTLLDRRVLMYRTPSGTPVAMVDKCPHRGVPLSRGLLIDDAVRCTYHGMLIGPDGACRNIPCQEHIPSSAKVTTYPLHERHGFVWIWIGDATRADPALIPDVHWMDDPAWAACSGYHWVGADYRLFNDNLLDLSHESYLHGGTIGNDAVAKAPVDTVASDGKVRVHRSILDCEPPPFYVKATGFTTRINRWHTTIFSPPSYNLIENGSYPIDKTRADALERRVIHLVTPETAVSSHYFWGVARPYRLDDADLTEFIRRQTIATFDEDKEMLEAQQASLGEQGGAAFPVALRTDAGPIQARRLLDRLIRQQQPQLQSEPLQELAR